MMVEDFSLAAGVTSLPKTRVRGFDFENETCIGGSSWLSSTTRPGCGYRCDGVAVVSTVQRYYVNAYGRFGTPDPYGKSAQPRSPLTWNRYSYTTGDPVNRSDPKGLCITDDQGNFWDTGDDVAYDWGVGDCLQNPEWLSMANAAAPGTVVVNGAVYGPGGGSVSVTDMPDPVPCVSGSGMSVNCGGDYSDALLQIAQAVTESNPQGFVNAFMGYSALAGAGYGSQLIGLAGVFAEGASAVNTLLLGSGAYVDPITGLYYSGYISIGGILGASTLNIPEDVWDAMSQFEKGAALTGGITQALIGGAQVVFSIDPETAAGWTAFEVQFITETLKLQIVQEGTSWVVVP